MLKIPLNYRVFWSSFSFLIILLLGVQENRFRDARDAYTKSLQVCPLDTADEANNKEYSIILANRSATLDSGRFYNACVQDIDLAFKYGYPRNLQFKVSISTF